MRSFKNIGASEYRRYTNTVVRSGESFTCASEREQEIIEAEGAIGIRLEEVFPAEPQSIIDAPLTLGALEVEPPEVLQREDAEVVVSNQGAQRKTSSKPSKRSSRR